MSTATTHTTPINTFRSLDFNPFFLGGSAVSSTFSEDSVFNSESQYSQTLPFTSAPQYGHFMIMPPSIVRATTVFKQYNNITFYL